MNKKTVLAITMLCIFVSLIYVPIATAQNRIQSGTTNIQSQLAYRYQNQEINDVNAAEYAPDQHFRDLLELNGYSKQGLYWGHGLPGYYIDHNYINHRLNFTFNYTFTHNDIETGAMGYWVRVPVNGLAVQELLVFNGSWNMGTLIARANNSRHNQHIIWDYTGVYMYLLDGLAIGHREYNFLVYPKIDRSIGVWVGNEDYSDNDNNISYYRIREIVNQSGVRDEIIDITIENYIGCPTLDILFQNGMDRGGYSSILVPAGKTIHYGYFHRENNTYPSIYMPFYGGHRTDFSIKFSIGSVDGRVGYSDGYIARRWAFENPAAPGHYAMFNNISCENVTDFLLISASWPLINDGWGGPTISSIYCWVQIRANEDITLYMAPNNPLVHTNSVSYISNLWDNRSIYYFNENKSIYDLLSYPHADCFGYHLYLTATQNTGVWAKTYNYSEGYTIDTGWAKGIRLPGDTVVYIMWDSGREQYFNGSVKDFREQHLTNPMSWSEAFKSGFVGAVRWLMDDYFEGLGEYDFHHITGLPDNIKAVSNEISGSLRSGLIHIFQQVWRFLEDNFNDMVSLIRILPWFIAVFLLEGTAYSVKRGSSLRSIFQEMKEKSAGQIARGRGMVDRYNRRGDKGI